MGRVEVFVDCRSPAIVRSFEKEGVDIAKASSEWVDYRRSYMLRITDLVVVEVLKPGRELLLDVYNEVLEVIDKVDRVLNRLVNTYKDVVGSHILPLSLYFTVDGFIETGYSSGLEWFHGQELINNILEDYRVSFIRDYDGITRVKVYTDRPYRIENVSKGLAILDKAIKLYRLVKVIQEAKALETTLSYLKELPR